MREAFHNITLLALLIWATAVSAAWQVKPIVWLNDDVSLQGRTTVIFTAVTNDTGQHYEYDAASAITTTLREKLQAGGIILLDSQDGAGGNAILMNNSLVSYEVGSAADRWALTGGATICSVRTTLFDAATHKLLGEIISTRIVDSGGLFSVGAYKYVPGQVAEEIAESLLPLLQGGDIRE